jgi:hypothetical protein
MISTLFIDPQALSSALAMLGTLQPRAFRSLNRVETLDSVSNCYVAHKNSELGAVLAFSIIAVINSTMLFVLLSHMFL